MFSVGPANLQHCLSPTYLCFLSAPLTSNSVSALLTYVLCPPRLPPTLSQSYLLMFFSFGPAYLQHCLSPTYLCFFPSAPLTSNTVSVLLTYVFFLRPRLPPTLSQSYLLMFFSLRPRLPPTLSVLLTYVFSFGPAYLQQSLSLSLFAGCRLSSPAV